MHGHRLRLEAERKHVLLWTDITVGAVYGAMKRLASEGLLRALGQEREGNRPTRDLYEITAEGQLALTALRREGLQDIWFRYDPFDLALTRMDLGSLESLPAVLTERLEKLRTLLADSRRVNAGAQEHVGQAKQWALRHTEYRLEAEVAYLTDLLDAVADLVADERLLLSGEHTLH